MQATKRFRAWEREHLPPEHHLLVVALSANVRRPSVVPARSCVQCSALTHSLRAQVFAEAIGLCDDAGMDGAHATSCAWHYCWSKTDAGVAPRLPAANAGFVPKPLRLDMLRAALATRMAI